MTLLAASAFRGRLAAALVAVAAACPLAPASAAELASPEGPVVLTVTGQIANTTDGSIAEFDRAGLEKLGTVALDTTTPWSDKVDHYEGVLARDVLNAVGADGTEILATALDNYVATIPLADFTAHDVIIALKMNGEYMTARDKGPLFIVYPFDQNPELKTEEIYARNVWALSEMEVK